MIHVAIYQPFDPDDRPELDISCDICDADLNPKGWVEIDMDKLRQIAARHEIEEHQ